MHKSPVAFNVVNPSYLFLGSEFTRLILIWCLTYSVYTGDKSSNSIQNFWDGEFVSCLTSQYQIYWSSCPPNSHIKFYYRSFAVPCGRAEMTESPSHTKETVWFVCKLIYWHLLHNPVKIWTENITSSL